MTAAADLVTHLARFAGALRARGVDVAMTDEIDATMALTLVDLLDRHEVRRAARIALKIRPRDAGAFDELFERFWTGGPESLPRVAPAPSLPVVPGRGSRLPSPATVWAPGGPQPRAGAEGDTPGYSADHLLRRKPFDECTGADLAAMERLLARAVPRLATRPSRRLAPARGRGVADLRRSLRRAIATSGDLVSLARRARRIEVPRLVVLCDTSGSMDPHARFLLAFALAIRRAARRTEIFAFNTMLVRITPWLASGDVGRTLERLAAGVPAWSGGTRIGESLADFVARYLTGLVTSRTVVLILSDGLDSGDTTLVAGAMRAIRSKARRVVWLNPLAADPRFEPTARAMQAALPYVDRLAPAHDLASLEHALRQLTA